MTTQTKTNTPDKPHEPAAVLEAVTTTALDGQTGTGAIAIFYGAARYPFELARQRELVEDYAEATGLNLVTEFHDRQTHQYGLSMLLDACQRGGVEYVITAGWPTPNLTTTEADGVTEQLAASGTHLVCLQAWQPGEGELPDWWDSAMGRQIRRLDELREHDRRQRMQASQSSDVSEDNDVGDISQRSDGSQSGGANEDNRISETSGIGQVSRTGELIQAGEPSERSALGQATGVGSLHELTQTSQTNETSDLSKEVRHA